jgi:hypothetical protein
VGREVGREDLEEVGGYYGERVGREKEREVRETVDKAQGGREG